MKHHLLEKFISKWGLPRKVPLITLLTIFLSVFRASGQEDNSKELLSYGAKIGFAMSEFNSDQPHTGGKIGFMIGGFGSYTVNDLLGVQVELNYLQQGGTYVQFIDDTRFGAPDEFVFRNVKDASVTLHSVYVPVQARFSLPLSNPLIPDLLIGPYADYNFAAREKYHRTGTINDGVYVTATGDEVVTDRFEQFQFGLVGGIQYDIASTSSLELVINASYRYGLTPAKEDHSYIDFTAVRDDLTTRIFILSIGAKL